jgi:hypothetical protein
MTSKVPTISNFISETTTLKVEIEDFCDNKHKIKNKETTHIFEKQI